MQEAGASDWLEDLRARKQVVAHQGGLVMREFALPDGLSAQLRRREREDQAARIGLDAAPAKHLSKDRPEALLGLRRGEQSIDSDDRHEVKLPSRP